MGGFLGGLGGHLRFHYTPTMSDVKMNCRGFTLIEILVVIGILGMMLAVGLVMNMQNYSAFARHSEHDVLVSILGSARSRAMAHSYEVPWGVCFDDAAKQYVLFRGETYSAAATTNEPLPASAGIVVSGMPLCSSGTGVVFAALTGNLVPQLMPTTSEITIVLTQNTETSTITINNAGRING